MKRAVVVVVLLLTCACAFAEERLVEVKVRADSEHPGNEAFRAMDGNPGSIWHSLWKPPAAVTDLPHEIVVDLGGVYEISGFTYAPRADSRNGRIKDYEAYLSGAQTTSFPLARNIGKPVAKGAFAKPDGENVVKFPAPVKGRYFRLRALSEVSGSPTWSGIAELRLHCDGVKFVGQPWSLKADFPEAGNDVITLIEGFPLLARLLELGDPWSWDPMVLKEQLFPEGMKPFGGGEENRGMFVDRRTTYDWQKISYAEAAERKPVDNPGQQIWKRHAYETNYYALDSARPLIRMHLGRPLLNYVDNMKVLFPKLEQAARRDIPAWMDRIVEALKPYGAKKLPKDYKSYPYILPGGTRMTITDYTVDGWSGRYGDSDYDDVRIKIDFEPAAVPKGRELMPQLVPWRAADAGRKAKNAPAGTLGHLQPPALAAAAAGKDVAGGKDAARQWSDESNGFASVDALGQNGTTGGAGGKVVTVTNQADLEKYAQMKEPYIIRVKGEIKVTEKKNPKTRYEHLTTREIHVASDKTIIGVGKTGH
ncbi:MAG: discoidin domain-containing protein, partial [Planctomycetota bacterium]